MMNRFKRTCALGLLTLALGTISSCEKILDTKPTNFQEPATYYSTEVQLRGALAAVYDLLGQGNFYGDVFTTQIVSPSDESVYRGNTGVNSYLLNETDNYPAVGNLWIQLYTGINRANQLLANMDRAEGVTDENRNRIRGEAKFLRAFYYFTLTQWYGDVPLRTEPTRLAADGQLAFTPTKDIYDFVIQEMTEAEDLLKNQKASTLPFNEQVTVTTVQGVLARACLFAAGEPVRDTKRYAEALAWAKKVVATNEHRLNPNFAQPFINMSADAYDNTFRESMWEVGHVFVPTQGTLREGSRSNIGVRNDPGNNPIGRVYGLLLATGRLYQSYAPGDLRRDRTVANYEYSSAGMNGSTTPVPVAYPSAKAVWNRWPGKWRREEEVVLPRDATITPRNYPLLRYSDVLLMLAEAENEVNGPTALAYDAINQVRRRGYGLLLTPAPVPAPPAATVVNLANLSQSTFRQAVRDERMRELAFEGLRRQDLNRWGIFVSSIQALANEATVGTPTIPAAPAGTEQSYYIALNGNVGERNKRLPIPQAELVNNKLAKQNPGF